VSIDGGAPSLQANLSRTRSLARLASETFDVLVIGGGITGAGVALDAATRGLRVALVERADWASGTSSKSSKLVHGGLRYLQQRDFRLVYEALHERQRLLRNAPHLVNLLPFVIPMFGKDGVVSKTVAKAYSTALWLYDITGGWRIGKRHRRLSVDETVAHMRGLDRNKVVAGFLFYDAQADDARLTLTLVRTAADHGATCLNYCAVSDLHTDAAGRVDGATLVDGTLVRARCVVNAAGVWSEQVMRMAGDVGARIRPAKGVHITVPYQKIQADVAAVVPVRQDRRSVFVVPVFDGVAGAVPERIYIGTTDTPYDGPLDAPTCTPADVAYVLDAMNDWLTVPLTHDDVLATWAGLRPLLEHAKSDRTADLSRRHAVVESVSTGLVSILGGKLTTYREMSEDTVDVVMRRLGAKSRCATRKLVLHGGLGLGALRSDAAAAELGVTAEVLAHLVGRYGSDARRVVELVRANTSLGAPLVPGLGYICAEAIYAVREESALTLEDVLSRRTRALLLDRSATLRAAPVVARLIAPGLGWTNDEVDAQVAAFRRVVDAELVSESH
jgi:glycerol-3-phosphate dehydrogenase